MRESRGFALDEPSQERANEATKRDCGSDACKVRFGVGMKMWAALATPDSGPAWGGAVRKSVVETKFAALKKLSEARRRQMRHPRKQVQQVNHRKPSHGNRGEDEVA
jgi:hypothetical protein